MLATIYGVLVYLLCLGSFAYAIGFVGNILVPRSVDGPAAGSPVVALVVNVALLALFAAQHSVMARKSFKAWWTRIVPPAVERSTFVLASSVCLFLLCWFWQPIEGNVWTVRDASTATALNAVFWLGWGVLFLATFLINHFELFGLRQVFAHLLGREIPETEFRTPFLYKLVRHPIYVGLLMAFWSTPRMTLGHLLFAIGGTGYILVGIWFEERDLVNAFGDRYRAYREQVGMLFPRVRTLLRAVSKAG